MIAQTTTSIPPINVIVNPVIEQATDWPGIVVGGIIGGLVVSIGVVLAEWLIRSRERRSKVRKIVSGIAFDMPILTAYYSDDPEAPRLEPGDYHGEFWRLRQDVLGGLNDLRTLPRWPMKNAKMIRANAEQLVALLTAATLRSTRGLRLSRADQVAITAHDRLHSLVFGTEPVSKDLVDHYSQEGFSMPSDSDS